MAETEVLRRRAEAAGLALDLLLPTLGQRLLENQRRVAADLRNQADVLEKAVARNDKEHRRLHLEVLGERKPTCRARGVCTGPQFMKSHSFMCGQLAAVARAARGHSMNKLFTRPLLIKGRLVTHEEGWVITKMMRAGFDQMEISLLALSRERDPSAFPIPVVALERERDRLKTVLYEYNRATGKPPVAGKRRVRKKRTGLRAL